MPNDKAKVRRTESGFSAIETMVGLAISGVVMTGVVQLMLQVGNTSANSQLQNLINETYLQGLQIANNPVLFADRGVKANPLGMGTALKACLAGNGTNCNTSADATAAPRNVPATVSTQLNSAFNFNGPCVAGAECLVQRRTQYQWNCPAPTFCSGLRVDVEATQIASTVLQSDMKIKPRRGSVFIPARQFMSKSEVDFSCPRSANTKAIFGVDYTRGNDAAHCATYTAGAPCVMPIEAYGTSNTCRQAQQNECTAGYQAVGLFSDQAACAGSVTGIIIPVITPDPPCPAGQTRQPDGTCLATPQPSQLTWAFRDVGRFDPVKLNGFDVKRDPSGALCDDGWQSWTASGPNYQPLQYEAEPGNPSNCPALAQDPYYNVAYFPEGASCPTLDAKCRFRGYARWNSVNGGTQNKWTTYTCQYLTCVDDTRCPDGSAKTNGTCPNTSGRWLTRYVSGVGTLPECDNGTDVQAAYCSPVGKRCRFSGQSYIMECGPN